jgi:hypothetical protein
MVSPTGSASVRNLSKSGPGLAPTQLPSVRASYSFGSLFSECSTCSRAPERRLFGQTSPTAAPLAKSPLAEGVPTLARPHASRLGNEGESGPQMPEHETPAKWGAATQPAPAPAPGHERSRAHANTHPPAAVRTPANRPARVAPNLLQFPSSWTGNGLGLSGAGFSLPTLPGRVTGAPPQRSAGKAERVSVRTPTPTQANEGVSSLRIAGTRNPGKVGRGYSARPGTSARSWAASHAHQPPASQPTASSNDTTPQKPARQQGAPARWPIRQPKPTHQAGTRHR